MYPPPPLWPRSIPRIHDLDKLESTQPDEFTHHRDLQELKTSIYPKYQNIASTIPLRRASLNTASKKLTTALTEIRRRHFQENEI